MSLSPRTRSAVQLLILAGVTLTLLALFPGAVAFVERAAAELRYLWWLILLLALATWLVWGIGRKPRP